MVEQSRNPVLARALVQAMVSALKTVPGGALLTTPKVHLFKTGPGTISQDSVIADFTEAAFNGYAPVTITAVLAGPVNAPTGGAEEMVAPALFTATSPVTSPGEVILGYYVDAGAPMATFVLGEYFPAPVSIVIGGDFIDLLVAFPAAFVVNCS